MNPGKYPPRKPEANSGPMRRPGGPSYATPPAADENGGDEPQAASRNSRRTVGRAFAYVHIYEQTKELAARRS